MSRAPRVCLVGIPSRKQLFAFPSTIGSGGRSPPGNRRPNGQARSTRDGVLMWVDAYLPSTLENAPPLQASVAYVASLVVNRKLPALDARRHICRKDVEEGRAKSATPLVALSAAVPHVGRLTKSGLGSVERPTSREEHQSSRRSAMMKGRLQESLDSGGGRGCSVFRWRPTPSSPGSPVPRSRSRSLGPQG